jgi:hypothetical protein
MSIRSIRKRKLPLKTSLTSFDVARWFLLDNWSAIPPQISVPLDGAIRSRNVRRIRELVDTWSPPQLYEGADQYAIVAQLFALLTKVPYPFGNGDQERRAKALDKFYKSEARCRRTTRRLDYYWDHSDRESPTMRLILTRARAHVDRVLGPVDRAVNRLVSGVRFGPGMTVCSTDSSQTTPYYKVSKGAKTVTSSARPYANAAFMSSPEWVRHHAEVDWGSRTAVMEWSIVKSCRLTFVPKDERSMRTIAIEPFGNVSLQLGLHDFMVERLRSVAGIDLSSQKWNQGQAQLGSVTGEVVTIDLSSASDCVSPGLVRRLVRPQWVALLDDLRSKYYQLEGVEYEFSKWSSMGNGYTFALETLLFWALAQSCEELCGSGHSASVYGDDIIVSASSALLVLEALRYAGFVPNPDKTFVVGHFRESCGSDWYDGRNVRPVFLKKFNLEVPDIFVLMNTIGKHGSRRMDTDSLWERLLNVIPKELRLFGPSAQDTAGHIFAPWWWLHQTQPPGFRYDGDLQTHFAKALVFRPKRYRRDDGVAYLTWLYSSRFGVPPDVVVTRRKRGSFRVCSRRCSVWSTVARNFYYLA